MPIPRKKSEEGKREKGKRIVDRSAVDARGKAYPLGQDLVKDILPRMDWERADDSHYVGVGKNLEAKSFDVLSLNDRGIRLNTEGLTH